MRDAESMTDQETIALLRARIDELEALVRAQAALIEQQAATIAQLQAAQSSRTSHSPPSSDSPKARSERKKRVRKKSRKKQGAQPGHKGSHRQLLEPELVDHLVECFPSHCDACGQDLTEDSLQVRRHQVWEIPPITPVVTEYRLHKRTCSCGCSTWARLPAQTVGESQFGPRVHAVVATMRTQARTSIALTKVLCRELFGLHLSTGSVSAIDKRTSDVLASDHATLHDALKQSDVAHLDETTWSLGGERYNLWVGRFEQGCCLLARESRDQVTAQELIGADYQGIAVTDRYCAYHWLDADRRQMCWAHLLRDFEAMSKQPGLLGHFGLLLRLEAQRVLHSHRRVRDGTLTHEEFGAYLESRQEMVSQCLQGAGQTQTSKKWGGAAREIFRHLGSLWTCGSDERVAPTNNAAERALRPSVITRKLSFGSQSERGLRWVERVQSVRETLRIQGRDFFDFLLAKFQGKQPPLIPA